MLGDGFQWTGANGAGNAAVRPSAPRHHRKGLAVTQTQAGSRPAGHDMICGWLGLPPGGWPPDHYALLGLQPGTTDLALIEQCVHDRLDTVRRYQLSHPEPATEAMNRLAQALVCLSSPAEKKVYDARLLGRSLTVLTPPEPEPRPLVPSAETAPPPPPVPAAPTPPPITAEPTEPTAEASPVLPEIPLLPAEMAEVQPTAALAPAAEQAKPAAEVEPERADPNEEAGRTGAARRGIGTKRALYRRIVRTRRLIALWEEAGHWLAFPKKRFSVTADGPELTRVLKGVRGLAAGFPVLGEAGQPGYFVLTLARSPTIPETFRMYQTRQREALARDWNAGKTLLRAHTDFLRQEVRSMRKKNWWAWTKRAAWAAVADQPIKLLILLGLLALYVALWRTLSPLGWFSDLFGTP